jgi:hypothetical protein
LVNVLLQPECFKITNQNLQPEENDKKKGKRIITTTRAICKRLIELPDLAMNFLS